MVFCVTVFLIPSLLIRRVFGVKKNIAHWVTQTFFGGVAFFSGVQLKVEGKGNFVKKRSYLLVSNHISAIDIVVLSCSIPGSFIYTAKDSLFRIFYFGWVLKSLDYLPIYRDDPAKTQESLLAAQRQIKEGVNSLLIFPEGTRGAAEKMLPFKSGFIKIAKALDEVSILPIVIEGSDRMMFKKELKIYPGKVRVRFLKPIALKKENFSSKEKENELKEKVQSLMQEAYDEMRSESLSQLKRKKAPKSEKRES